MKKNYAIFLLLPLLITSSFCGKNREHGQEPTEVKVSDVVYHLTAELVKKKIMDADYIQVFTWMADDNYLLLESFNQREDTYEFRFLDGELNESGKYALKRGQGPRELLKPFFTCGTLEEIFIYDGMARRILRCDKEFKECKMTKVSMHGEDYWGTFGYSRDSGFCLTCDANYEISSGKSINDYFLRDTRHATGKEKPFHTEKYKYRERQANGETIFWRGPTHNARLIDDFVFLINLETYTIYKYDLKGRLIKSIRVPFKRKTYTKSHTKEIVAAWNDYVSPSTTYYYPLELWPACWILQVDKGVAVGRRESYLPSTEKWITADYFDLELNFLGKIRLPAFRWWNHPSDALWIINKLVFTRGNKMWLSSHDEDTEEVSIEEWSFTHD